MVVAFPAYITIVKLPTLKNIVGSLYDLENYKGIMHVTKNLLHNIRLGKDREYYDDILLKSSMKLMELGKTLQWRFIFTSKR